MGVLFLPPQAKPLPYDQAFYQNQAPTSLQSAQQVLPVVLDYIRPTSVVDIGCGVGTWLSVWQALGIPKIQGIDGHYVKTEQLQIPRSQFYGHDLSEPLPETLISQFRCDLVSSLEVAEHLPAFAADEFVKTLTRLSDVVLFSAAIPHQGGVGHVNEQWPDYWAQKFEALGYVVIDCIRPRIWDNPGVSWWYAQNILLFVKQSALSSYPALQGVQSHTHRGYLNKIHPKKYLAAAQSKRKKGWFTQLTRPLKK